jgi:hypothetical protein
MAAVVSGTSREWFPRTRVVARFLAGRPLDGRRRTDATFLRPGWKAYGHHYLNRFDYWPGWQLAALRVAGLTLGGYVAWETLTSPTTLIAEANLAVRIIIVCLSVVLVRGARSWAVKRHVVHPLAAAVRGHLEYSIDVPNRRWVHVPRSLVTVPPVPPFGWIAKRLNGTWLYRAWGIVGEKLDPLTSKRRAKAAVRITLPHSLGHVPSDARKAIVASASSRLGGAWVPDWQLSGPVATLVLKPRPEPPSRVTFAQFQERLPLLKPNELGIGFSAGYRTVSVDLDMDSPHILLSMGSGAGKSVTVRWLASQAIAKGWAVILMDYKQDHYWCADLMAAEVPGVLYLRKIPDIHKALIKLQEVREWRSDIDFEYRGKAPMQRALIIFEEMNATADLLREYWRKIKVKGDPQKSPALTAFGQLSYAGRSASMNLVGIGQYLTAQVFGGPEARENFGSRWMARYTPAAWKTMVPEYGQAPRKSSVRGRIQVCQDGGDPIETQVVYMTDDQVREHALAGLAGVRPAGMIPFSWEPLDTSELPVLSPVPPGGQPAPDLQILPGLSPTGDMRDLQGWIQAEVLPLTYEAAKKRRQRNPGSLPADRSVYTEQEIRAWLASG